MPVPSSTVSRRTLLGAAGTGMALWAAGCAQPQERATASSNGAGERAPVPSAEWEVVSPSTAGWDSDRLEEAIAFAASSGTQTILVVLAGRILAERDFGVDRDFTREVASCQKSVVSLLIGMAADRRLLHIDDPVSTHLGGGWSNAAGSDEKVITVRHLLSMTSGLDGRLERAADPGRLWSYNNSAYHLLQPILEAVTATGIDALCRDWLWEPIGATASSWAERPGAGPNAVGPKGRRLWGLTMSARDMGRFGLLVIRRGRWGDQVLSTPSFLSSALSPSSEANPSYGYLWWLNGQPTYRIGEQGTARPGPLVPAAPPDMVAALGKDDQKIYVSQSDELVIVRQGDRAGTRTRETLSSFDEELWRRVMAAAPT